MFYAYKDNNLICGSDKKETVIKICKNLKITDYEITEYEKIIPKTDAELEAEHTQQTVNEIEAQLADMRERMVYAMLIGDDDLIQSIREEYSEVMNG